MLSNIATHLLVGTLGVGKTSLLRSLLRQKPTHERWALLINEFGQVGLDAALLASDQAAVATAEVAGGCLCCVSGAPFQTQLARLLRQAQPQRLFIEPSGLGHPLTLWRQLQQAPWQGVLTLQPPVLVVDAAAIIAGQPLSEAQQALLPQVGQIVMNKSESIPESCRQQWQAHWSPIPLYWTTEGELPLRLLPGFEPSAQLPATPMTPARVLSEPAWLWTDSAQPLCQIHQDELHWSIGWRWHPQHCFSLPAIARWLADEPWIRAKLIVHTEQGWQSANLVQGMAFATQPSEWRKDSRLELIFTQPQDDQTLSTRLRACLV